jgi:hypothetical protein
MPFIPLSYNPTPISLHSFPPLASFINIPSSTLSSHSLSPPTTLGVLSLGVTGLGSCSFSWLRVSGLWVLLSENEGVYKSVRERQTVQFSWVFFFAVVYVHEIKSVPFVFWWLFLIRCSVYDSLYMELQPFISPY